MTHDYDEDDYREIEKWSLIAFRSEVHHYGIADGMYRKPLDQNYVDWPEYVQGHKIGMGLEQQFENLANE